MLAGHAKGEDRTEAEANANTECEEGAQHDQPFTGAAGAGAAAETGEPLTV
jgi:hypothetical protein